jgi:hypothetical protein
MPFANTLERDTHFEKHGHKFGAIDAVEYERMADQFMFGPMNADTRQCFRQNRTANADRLRCEIVLRHFGIAGTEVGGPEFIRSFYPPTASLIHRCGGMAGFFTIECGRINL